VDAVVHGVYAMPFGGRIHSAEHNEDPAQRHSRSCRIQTQSGPISKHSTIRAFITSSSAGRRSSHAVLLLIPATSHIGAMMFLVIIVNIAVLTCSVGFAGTWLLTILMSLAGLWLFCWEYDRLKPIFFQTRVDKPRKFRLQFITIPLFLRNRRFRYGRALKLIRLGNFRTT
jgi:hypothetical protein